MGIGELSDRNALFGITCLLSVNMAGSSGISSSYLLACDSVGALHFTQNGVLTQSRILPSVINDVRVLRKIYP